MLKDVAPRDGVLKDGALKDVAPRDAVLKDAVLKDAGLRDAAAKGSLAQRTEVPTRSGLQCRLGGVTH